jgi:lysophospholipase L1-like esterase
VFFPISEKKEYKNTVTQNIRGLKEIVTYERNEFGFRSLSMKLKEKPANTIRILCLGASTTDQTTQDTRDTWSGILEKKLNEKFSGKNIFIEVAARGRSGELIADRAKWLKSSLLKFQPDIVVTLEGINDLAFWDSSASPHQEWNKDDDEITFSEKLARFSQITRRAKVIKNKIQLAKLLKEGRAVEWHSKHLEERKRKYQNYPYVDVPSRSYDPLNRFKNDLDEMVSFVTDKNIGVVVLGQPVLYNENMTPEELRSIWFPIRSDNGKIRPSIGWLVKEVDRFNGAQEEIAKKYNAQFVDLNKIMPKNLKVFFDDCHYTDYGSEALADAVMPQLAQLVDAALAKRLIAQ